MSASAGLTLGFGFDLNNAGMPQFYVDPDSSVHAEVTAGGVDTDGLSSKTLEAKHVPGLYFVGEVVDVTGAGDTVIKLRPVDPAAIDKELRRAESFKTEVDVVPGGFVSRMTPLSMMKPLFVNSFRISWKTTDIRWRQRITGRPH